MIKNRHKTAPIIFISLVFGGRVNGKRELVFLGEYAIQATPKESYQILPESRLSILWVNINARLCPRRNAKRYNLQLELPQFAELRENGFTHSVSSDFAKVKTTFAPSLQHPVAAPGRVFPQVLWMAHIFFIFSCDRPPATLPRLAGFTLSHCEYNIY